MAHVDLRVLRSRIPSFSLQLDGQEITEVSDLSIEFPLDGLAELKMATYIKQGSTLELEANVTVQVALEEGQKLHQETLHNGHKLYWITRV